MRHTAADCKELVGFLSSHSKAVVYFKGPMPGGAREWSGCAGIKDDPLPFVEVNRAQSKQAAIDAVYAALKELLRERKRLR